MSTHIYKIILAAVLSLSFNLAYAKKITGKQCRALLSPVVDQLDSNTNRKAYLEINNEITNVLGLKLEQIAKIESQTPSVKKYVESVRNIISQCESTCAGIRSEVKRTPLSCKALQETGPEGVRKTLSMFTDDETVEMAQTHNTARCSFEPDAEGCKKEDKQESKTETITKDVAAVTNTEDKKVVEPQQTAQAPSQSREEIHTEDLVNYDFENEGEPVEVKEPGLFDHQSIW